MGLPSTPAATRRDGLCRERASGSMALSLRAGCHSSPPEVEQDMGRDLECVGDAPEPVDRGGVGACLRPADRLALDPGSGGELFLAQPEGRPPDTNGIAQSSASRRTNFVGGRHSIDLEDDGS